MDNASLTSTVNSQAVIRAGAYQDVSERPGLTGAAAVYAGGLSTSGGTTRNGVIDVVIGDSIGVGDGGTLGVTDWATVIATTENRTNGLVDPGAGFIPLSRPYEGGNQWSSMASGSAAAAGATGGPSGFPTAWKITSGSIGDNRTFRRVQIFFYKVTNGDAVSFSTSGVAWPNLGTAASSSGTTVTLSGAGATTSGLNVGDTITKSAGTGTIPAGTTVASITDSTHFVLSGTPSPALSGATLVAAQDTNGSGIGVWDSGDLGYTSAGTGITCTYRAGGSGTGYTGSGGGGVTIIGARYYQTTGTNGTSIDNLAVGGTTSAQWATYIANTTQWLTLLANTGTPARRVYVFLGLNDALLQYSTASYTTNLATIITSIQAASPLSEIVLVAEHYGDQFEVVSGVSTTSGNNVITVASGGFPGVNVGATVTGLGIPANTKVTVLAGNNCTISNNASATNTGQTMTFNIPRGGPTTWATSWVPIVEQAALTYGCTLVNMWERFGDISGRAQVTTASITKGSTAATIIANTPVAIGMYVSGTGIINGTQVANVSGTSLTLSIPATQTITGSATLTFTMDQFGLGQASSADIHFGDSSQSLSGRDGPRARAETFMGKLAYSNQTQSPSVLQGSVASDGKIVSSVASTLLGGGVMTGYYLNSADTQPAIALEVSPTHAAGVYWGAGGSSAPDTAIVRLNPYQLLATAAIDVLATTVTVTANAGTVPSYGQRANFTNSSAATMTITLTTSGAVDGQTKIVRIYDFSAVAQTISWVNTENSGVTVPTTSNGSTTLPLTVGFVYNGSTSKWRCVAVA